MIEGEKLIPINIEEQMKTAYIDYSMSVIVSRALPDIRDGLKPVHRRVLFGMHELGVRSNTPYKKSALYMILWFVWRKNGICVICLWMVRVTLAL